MTPAKPPTLLSPRDYAKRRGVTRQAVMRAIATGRLSSSCTKTDAGHWRIDPMKADREWERMTDQAKSRATKAGGRPAQTGHLFAEERQRSAVSHARASADRIQVDTDLKRLDLEERRGRLIDRDAVTRAAFTVARECRAAILAIPDAIAADVHAARSIPEVHHLLMRELAAALETLSRLRIEDLEAHP